MSARLLTAAGQTPLTIPGASSLLSWNTALRTNALTPSTAAMVLTGTSPAINCTGTLTTVRDVWLKCTLGGALGTAKLQFSTDGGATYNGVDLLTAATVTGAFQTATGLTANCATGTYVLNDTWRLPWSALADSSQHARSYATSGVGFQPTLNLSAPTKPLLLFDGVNDFLDNADSAHATAIVGGSDTPCTVFCVGRILTAGGKHFLWAIANGLASNSYFALYSESNTWRVVKRGDTGSELVVFSGTTDTLLHVFEVVHFGTTVALWIDGVQIIGTGGAGVAQDANSLTVSHMQLGSILSIANQAGNVEVGALVPYAGALDATTRGYIRQNLKNSWGTP